MTRASVRPFPLLLLASLVLAEPAAAADIRLAPFKDELFAYPPGSTSRDNGADVSVAYSEMRDINGRDEIPERRVRMSYVDAAPLRSQVEAAIDTPKGPVKVMEVGERSNPKATVLFVHGRNGDRRLGMYDRTFGGNFNRLKNLMARAGGLYATVDAGTFGDGDRARVAAVIEALGREPGRGPFVLACASMGGEFCWDLLGQPAVAQRVSGVVMISANNVPAKLAAARHAAGKRPLPVVFVHGTRDKVFAWAGARSAFEQSRTSKQPVRFVSMEDGNHGTPIRMIDWRETLNWLFAQAD